MRSDEGGDPPADGLGAMEPLPIERDRHGDTPRRVRTLAFIALLCVAALFLVVRVGGVDVGTTPASPEHAPGTSPLAAGTYRLPGLSTPVSMTLPGGWFAGDSLWGPAGQGIAAISIGRPGSTVSIGVFDLGLLRPFRVEADAALGHRADPAWFARAIDGFRSRVEPRVRDGIVGTRVDWRPPPVLVWLLTRTGIGPIHVIDDVEYDGLRGDLVTFSFSGRASPLFEQPGGGTLALRPGVTYTFWAPQARGPANVAIVLGIARERGSVPGTTEWGIVRTLRFGP
jgi:hypothetical protein